MFEKKYLHYIDTRFNVMMDKKRQFQKSSIVKMVLYQYR